MNTMVNNLPTELFEADGNPKRANFALYVRAYGNVYLIHTTPKNPAAYGSDPRDWRWHATSVINRGAGISGYDRLVESRDTLQELVEKIQKDCKPEFYLFGTSLEAKQFLYTALLESL